MKHLVRIIGRNGVVYEERLTQAQIRQFLQSVETRNSLGVAFDEWQVTILAAGQRTLNHQEQEEAVLLMQGSHKELHHA